MIPGDPQADARKALALDLAVSGFRTWLDTHKDDPAATFVFEVRDGRFFGVQTTMVAWYSRAEDAGPPRTVPLTGERD